MSPNYRHYLTIGSDAEVEVFPSGDWTLGVKPANEDFPWCNDYRIKAEGDFVFSGEDYDRIINGDCCNKLEIRITCDGHNYWIGYFSWPYDLEINEDTCQISGTPKPLDKYYYFDQFADEKYTSLTRSTTFQYQNDFPVAPPADSWSVCLPCELLWDVITDIATNAPTEPSGFTYTVKSTFFENDLFPDGTNPFPTNNYVTGSTNKLNHIVMAMTQDVCSLETVVANLEDMPEWSWNDIMERIHNVFNTWWYIDENGEIRIEHIYFWELYFGASYDLTTLDDGAWIERKNKYSFRSSEIPVRENWLFSDNNVGLADSYITYYNCFLPGTTRFIKDYSLTELTTYIEYIAPGTNNFVTSPADCNDIASEDYMFIRCIPRNTAQGLGYSPTPACPWCAWFSQAVNSGIDHVNAHFWPLNLLVNYWTHDRPLWEGRIPLLGADPVYFESTQKNLVQRDIIFPVCCDAEAEIVITGSPGTDPRYLYDFPIFNKTVITQYGEGYVYDGNVENGMFRGSLAFEDTCGEGDTPTEWSEASEL